MYTDVSTIRDSFFLGFHGVYEGIFLPVCAPPSSPPKSECFSPYVSLAGNSVLLRALLRAYSPLGVSLAVYMYTVICVHVPPKLCTTVSAAPECMLMLGASLKVSLPWPRFTHSQGIRVHNSPAALSPTLSSSYAFKVLSTSGSSTDVNSFLHFNLSM